MARTRVAVLGLVLAASVTVSVVIGTAASLAGPPPPIYFFLLLSRNPPVAGHVWTPVLVSHSLDPWTLTCSGSYRGGHMAGYVQEFGYTTFLRQSHTRSCSFYVPREAAGKALALTVNATDPSGHSDDYTRGWRVVSHAASPAADVNKIPASRAAPPPGGFHFRVLGSTTPPVAGRAFTAVLVMHSLHTGYSGGPWTLTCSASLRGHYIVPHLQQFGSGAGVMDVRSCSFYVPRGTVGKGLAFTVDATDPTGNSRHATGGWRIVSRS